ncbi:MAG: hypothetical protein LBV38_02135 [Alistipes sp.]|jgi:hypothetical protein|nr:hypothetical protein [Alistipes sp.]
MKKRFFGLALAMCALVMSIQAQAQTQFPEALLGKWIVSIDNPQTGETIKGTCTIARDGEETRATFEVPDVGPGSSQTTPFRVNELTEGEFIADLDVGGYLLGVYFGTVDGKLTCEMDADGYAIPMTIQRDN